MKKIIISIILVFIFILSGCTKQDDVVNNLKTKIEKTDSYHLKGKLEVVNNETTYTYDVNTYSKKGEMFKVNLKNTINQHEQILLKNEKGVYVLNPSLNKSFKFQSDWPYNNSQAYLLETIMEDILNDKEKIVENKENEYIITTKANYTNNKELVNQKIYIDKNNNISKVEVLNENGQVKISMKIDSINMDANLTKEDFSLETNMVTSSIVEKSETKLEDINYPMYLPENTNLSSQDTLKTSTGERIILTFSGDSDLTIIQQATKMSEEYEVINVEGEPILLADSVGAISDGAITWISNGVEYYAASNNIEQSELISVARSLSVNSLDKPVSSTLEK